MSSSLTSRAGRYTAHRERPELCQEAAARLGLVNVVFRQFDGWPFVAGDDAQGAHRLYCARTWAEIAPAAHPLGNGNGNGHNGSNGHAFDLAEAVARATAPQLPGLEVVK